MRGFLHQLLSGVADGGIYASLALALVMIYRATHHVNFAQGAMAMFSTYIAWAMIDAGFPYWAACGLTWFLRSLPMSPSKRSSSGRWNAGRC